MKKIIATLQNIIDYGIVSAAFFLFAASVISHFGAYSGELHSALIMLSSAVLLHLAIKNIERYR